MVLLLLHVVRVDNSFRGLGIIAVFENLTSELCEGSGWGGSWGPGILQNQFPEPARLRGGATDHTFAVSVSPLLHPAPR